MELLVAGELKFDRKARAAVFWPGGLSGTGENTGRCESGAVNSCGARCVCGADTTSAGICAACVAGCVHRPDNTSAAGTSCAAEGVVRGLVSPGRQKFSVCGQTAMQVADLHHAHTCEKRHVSLRCSFTHTCPFISLDEQTPGKRFRHSISFAA